VPRHERIKPLPDSVTSIPINVRCPISFEVLQDPVIAADGHTYSLQAITKWFQVRKSSPLTGLALPNTEVTPDHNRADQASGWVRGDDLLRTDYSLTGHTPKRQRTSDAVLISVTLSSNVDSFTRMAPTSLSIQGLYELALRGMRARHSLFELKHGDTVLKASPETIGSCGLNEDTTIMMRIQDVGNQQTLMLSGPQNGRLPADQPCLIKIYGTSYDKMDMAYWTSKDTSCTLATVIVKYWRKMLSQDPYLEIEDMCVWTGIKQAGDSQVTGNLSQSETHLADLLTSQHARGVLRSESVYGVESQDRGDALEDEYAGTRPLVLKVWMQSHHTIRKTAWSLSRLQVLKQMFEALITRVLAYSFSTHVGLTTFNTEAKTTQSLTHVIENFRRSVEGMHATGDTVLWDALSLANQQISQDALKFRDAKRRIICLSDGQDTGSTSTARDVYWQLRLNNVVVDSVLLGNEENQDLKTMSHFLGSYCFRPQDMTSALAICELEPMLSQTERPTIVQAVYNPRYTLWDHFESGRRQARITTVTRDVYPKRKPHPRLADSFVRLVDTVHAGRSTSVTRSNVRSSRLLSEMRNVAGKSHPMYDAYVSEADMSFWKVIMEGVSTMKKIRAI